MGKTTTANMFRELGYKVFDADAVVHGLYAEGGRAVALIKAVFPDAIIDGAIDRNILGQHMRADPLNLQVLESFIHPMVAEERSRFIKAAEVDKEKIIIFDVPLLFETKGDAHMDAVIVVTAPKDIQTQRVLARPGVTPALFEKLLSRQMADDKKRALADYLVFTDKGLDFARKQIQNILEDVAIKFA